MTQLLVDRRRVVMIWWIHIANIILISTVHSWVQPQEEYRTHFIHWNISNNIFKTSDSQLVVHQDDEIVFVCPQDTDRNFEVRFTYDYNAYVMCDFWASTHLVVCDNLHRTSSENPSYRFIATNFQYIPGNPEFKLNTPVFFLARHFYCYNNMKLQIMMKARGEMYNEAVASQGSNHPPQQDGDVTTSGKVELGPTEEKLPMSKSMRANPSNGSFHLLSWHWLFWSLCWWLIHAVVAVTTVL